MQNSGSRNLLGATDQARPFEPRQMDDPAVLHHLFGVEVMPDPDYFDAAD